MFFKFNTITQRLSSATQDIYMGRPATAQALAVSPVSETKETYYEFKPLAPPKAPSGRQMSTGKGMYPIPNHPTYRKLMELQTHFTLDDGKLVWQKMPKDKALYYLAIGLVVSGTMLTMYTLKKMCDPPKNE